MTAVHPAAFRAEQAEAILQTAPVQNQVQMPVAPLSATKANPGQRPAPAPARK